MSIKKPEPPSSPFASTLVIEPVQPTAPRHSGTLVMEPPRAQDDEAPPETLVISNRAGIVDAPFQITEAGAPPGDHAVTRAMTPWAEADEPAPPAVRDRSFAPGYQGRRTAELEVPSVVEEVPVEKQLVEPEPLPPRAQEPRSPTLLEDLLPPSDPWGAGLRELEPRSARPSPPKVSPTRATEPNRRSAFAKSLYTKLGAKR